MLVLEKAPWEERGGNSRFSGGLFRFTYDSIEDIRPLMPGLPADDWEYVDVGTYSADCFYADIMKVTQGRANPKLSRILVDQSLPTVVWMAELQVAWAWTNLWVVEEEGRRRFSPGCVLDVKSKGVGLMESLFVAIERADIDVAYQAKMEDFVLSKDGKVTGLKVKTSGGVQEIRAGTVVLASGGFEANP